MLDLTKTTSANTIPISLCFNVEPTLRCIDPDARLPWNGFEELVEQVARRRELFERATGAAARFCWALRLDPQIEHTYGSAGWVVTRYRHIFDKLLAEGDELGVHPHAWRWEPELGHWLADHGNDSWVDHCVRLALRTYEQCFGRKARVSQIGDRVMTNKLMSLLEELGIVCDLTPEPGQRAVPGLVLNEHSSGSIPDYRRVPRSPYRPSRRDFRRPGRYLRRNIWVLPVSTGKPSVTHGLTDPPPECLAMLMGLPFPAMKQMLEQNLNRSARPHIVAVARTDVTLDSFNRDQFEQFLDFLIRHPLRERFRFSTPLETLRILTGETAVKLQQEA